MKTIPFQQDGVTELAAADFNEIPREEENLIISAGISLDAADLYQLGKAAAVYGGGGDFYTDSGSATAYALAPLTARQRPPAYFKGLRVRFKATTTNTGSTATAALDSLAALAISRRNLGNGDPAVLSAGDILINEIVTLVYDESPDGLTLYWRLEPMIGDSRITDFDLTKGFGAIKIGGAGTTWNQDVDGLRYDDSSGDYLSVDPSAGIEVGTTAGDKIELDADGIDITAASGEAFAVTPNFAGLTGSGITTGFENGGHRFLSGPGEAAYDAIAFRRALFVADVGFATGVVIGSGIEEFIQNTAAFVTDIPIAAAILGGTLQRRVGANIVGPKYAISFTTGDDGSGFHEVSNIVTLAAPADSPDGNNILMLEFDASGL